MAITLYDLCGAESDRRFSPFCWRIKMALAHKGLVVETVPWRFTEKDKLPTPNAGVDPSLVLLPNGVLVLTYGVHRGSAGRDIHMAFSEDGNGAALEAGAWVDQCRSVLDDALGEPWITDAAKREYLRTNGLDQRLTGPR